jgi:hypothetical protein
VNVVTLPAWADAVAEPFRSDQRFWRSVYASADALLAVVIAAVFALALAFGVGGAWVLVPFVLPVPFIARAAHAGWTSSRANRAEFAERRREWRAAERQAVASVFRHVLLRNRLRHP